MSVAAVPGAVRLPAYKQVEYDHVRQFVPPRPRLLDYGSGGPAFLHLLAPDIESGIGIDIDRRILTEAKRQNGYRHIRHIYADARAGLPFPAGYFDAITALGVLEHVGSERPFLREFHRVLKPGGSLIVAVPARGPFRFFDVGNIKFRFPHLHRWFYALTGQRVAYTLRFTGGRMNGQFSHGATWHKHYSMEEMSSLLAPGFEIRQQARFGLCFELIQFLDSLTGAHSLFLPWLARDCGISGRLAAANLVVCATRI